MTAWHVVVTVEQSDKVPELDPVEVEALDNALPGGGTSTSYAGTEFYATRRLTKSLTVEAADEDEARDIARAKMQKPIDPERFPGWSVVDVGDPKRADS